MFMTKLMTNQMLCTLVYQKGMSWEIQGKCFNKKKKNPWREDFIMICQMSFVWKFKVANWYVRSPSLFCCDNNGVLSVNTFFILCDSWVTDTCYYNKSLLNSFGHYLVFLGPTFIHFEKDSSIFRRFLLEMCTHNTKIKDLRTIGRDQEMAIFNGFSSILPNLNLLLCVYHL